MFGFAPFYHSTIKNTTAAFGTLFNDMTIERKKGNKTQKVKVPLQYAAKDKAFVRRTQDPDMNNDFQATFPRMAFNLTGLQYDPTRKINPVEFQRYESSFQRAPIPYNINYELYIASATIEDGLQIVEQILPFFNPEYTVTTKEFDGLGLKMDIPFILESVGFTDSADTLDFTEQRIIEWTLSFVAKAYMFGPNQSGKLIQKVNNYVWLNEDQFQDDTMIDSDVQHIIDPFTVPTEATPHEVVTSIIEKQYGDDGSSQL